MLELHSESWPSFMRIRISGSLFIFGLAFRAFGQDPDQAAAKTFERVCGGCHDSATAAGARHSRLEWQGVVEDMASRGASATDAETREIVDWLARHYGAVRINQLKAGGLKNDMGLTAEEAEAIITYRSKHGKFDDFEALKKVPGVDPAKLKSYKDSIVY
jgi:competence protein ComEA